MAATAPPGSGSILRLRTVGMSMTDGETASLHVRISFGERVVDFFQVGAASN